MTTNKINTIIAGAGFVAKDIADLVVEFPTLEVIGFVIDQPPFEHGTKLSGKPIFWIDELEEFKIKPIALCGLARTKKLGLINRIKSFGISFVELIHPSSRISSSVQLGEGVVINSGVHIAIESFIGNFVYINRGCLIGHDVTIGDLSVISAGTNIAGNVRIGKGTYVGMGAIITERVNIGEGSFIGAGSLVTKDIPDHTKVVGSPAKIIETGIDFY